MAQQHQVSSAGIGLILSIGGVGSILGAFLVHRVQKFLSFAQLIIGVLWLYAAFWLLLALLPSPFFLGPITALLFFIGPFYNVTYVSRRLAMTPDSLQSRVNSVARLIGLGLSPLSIALTGFLLQYYGAFVTISLSAAGQVLLAFIATGNVSIRSAPLLSELAAATPIDQSLVNDGEAS